MGDILKMTKLHNSTNDKEHKEKFADILTKLVVVENAIKLCKLNEQEKILLAQQLINITFVAGLNNIDNNNIA